MLYYHQITKVINVEDDEGAGTTTPPTMVNGIDEANLFKDSTTVPCAEGTTEVRDDTGYNEGTAIPVKLCSLPNTTENGKPSLVNSRASGAVVAMFDQMKKDLSLDSIAINDSFRTMAEQQALRASLGSQAAPPGYSNHQMGYAFDVNMGMVNYKKDVNTSYPGNRIWEWLKTNAGKYHFSQYAAEGWHWSVNGK
jgi:LAS superfamily LD-carboxypeptidase LdcB